MRQASLKPPPPNLDSCDEEIENVRRRLLAPPPSNTNETTRIKRAPTTTVNKISLGPVPVQTAVLYQPTTCRARLPAVPMSLPSDSPVPNASNSACRRRTFARKIVSRRTTATTSRYMRSPSKLLQRRGKTKRIGRSPVQQILAMMVLFAPPTRPPHTTNPSSTARTERRLLEMAFLVQSTLHRIKKYPSLIGLTTTTLPAPSDLLSLVRVARCRPVFVDPTMPTTLLGFPTVNNVIRQVTTIFVFIRRKRLKERMGCGMPPAWDGKSWTLAARPCDRE